MQETITKLAFDTWFCFIESKKKQRLFLSGFVSRWHNRALRSGLFTWKLWARDARMQEEMRRIELQRMRSVVSRIQRRSVCRAFEAWHAMLCLRRRLRSFAATLVHRHMSMALRGWTAYVESRVKQRSLMRRMLSRWRADKMHKAWITWTKYVLMGSAEAERVHT